jgi:hypothetical protein
MRKRQRVDSDNTGAGSGSESGAAYENESDTGDGGAVGGPVAPGASGICCDELDNLGECYYLRLRDGPAEQERLDSEEQERLDSEEQERLDSDAKDAQTDAEQDKWSQEYFQGMADRAREYDELRRNLSELEREDQAAADQMSRGQQEQNERREAEARDGVYQQEAELVREHEKEEELQAQWKQHERHEQADEHGGVLPQLRRAMTAASRIPAADLEHLFEYVHYLRQMKATQPQ